MAGFRPPTKPRGETLFGCQLHEYESKHTEALLNFYDLVLRPLKINVIVLTLPTTSLAVDGGLEDHVRRTRAIERGRRHQVAGTNRLSILSRMVFILVCISFRTLLIHSIPVQIYYTPEKTKQIPTPYSSNVEHALTVNPQRPHVYFGISSTIRLVRLPV